MSTLQLQQEIPQVLHILNVLPTSDPNYPKMEDYYWNLILQLKGKEL